MVTVDDFSRLVSGIYTAAVTPQHWELAIGDIGRMLGANGGTLVSDGRAVHSTLPPEIFVSYAQHYHRLDHVLEAVEKGPVGAVRTSPEVMVSDRNGEFYAGWLHPNQLEDGLFVRLTGGPRPARAQRPACFVVTSAKQSFDTPERVRLMGALVGHLQQALRTQDKLAALTHSAVEIAGALEVIRHGIVVVASENIVVHLNSVAERIFRAKDGLCIRSGRIAATSTHTDRELHLAMHNALTGERSAVRTGQSLTCVRLSAKRPYVIHVLPFHRRDADESLSRPSALVLIIDPEDDPEPSAALLRRLYRLTKAEADVALYMMHGAHPKQISDELSVSLATVRTHLQHVFDKTDTHRQAELMRLLLVVSPEMCALHSANNPERLSEDTSRSRAQPTDRTP